MQISYFIVSWKIEEIETKKNVHSKEGNRNALVKLQIIEGREHFQTA